MNHTWATVLECVVCLGSGSSAPKPIGSLRSRVVQESYLTARTIEQYSRTCTCRRCSLPWVGQRREPYRPVPSNDGTNARIEIRHQLRHSDTSPLCTQSGKPTPMHTQSQCGPTGGAHCAADNGQTQQRRFTPSISALLRCKRS
ncbi:hypothetical protein P171DRAFT_175602 [Karstenula rhodostoma CBS 690.94]|uniref:Uncharacterized protein n=1 Tax=Karstenula rhodostoma CBS 690.94 TaxID=1392251 RepID=A0A9P4P5X0_9PLEO|nr:hypothetical protein P171DRAFT_175602 [Karstenula rhodostoma CBS 690.94]